MPQKRTLSIGGATYDLFVRVPSDTIQECRNQESFALPLGAKIRVDDLVEACGGGACNTSVGLSRLGCHASFEGVVGSDQWGEALRMNLKRENVHTDCVTVVEGEVSSFSIILSGHSGERVILYEPGTNAHLHDANFNKERIEEMDWVYLNHIQEGSCVIQDDIVEMLTASEKPMITWNPGGCQIDMGHTPENNGRLLAHTNLLLLNKEEAMKFAQKDDVLDALKTLLDAGAKHVCITDGARGTQASDGTTLYNCPVVNDTHIVDTTGAGDAFGTGVTWGLLQGMTLKESLKVGTINAASVVQTIGAQPGLLTDTEMRKQLQKSNLHVEESGL